MASVTSAAATHWVVMGRDRKCWQGLRRERGALLVQLPIELHFAVEFDSINLLLKMLVCLLLLLLPPPTLPTCIILAVKKRTHAKDELCPSSCAPPPSSHIYLQPHLAIFSSQCCCLFSYAIKGYYVMADPNEVRRPPGRQPHRSQHPAQPSPTLVNQAMCRAGLCCTALG